MNYLRSVVLLFVVLSISSFAQNYAPAMDYSAMLNVRFYENSGGFMLETIPMFFPPQGMNKVEFEIATSNGQSKLKTGIYVNKWQQFPIVDGVRPQGTGIIHLKQTGDFVLRVKVSGKEITRIPFKMSVQSSGDPFNPQSTYTKEGPWNKLGYFSVNPNRPDDAISFNWWTRIGEMPGAKGGKMTVHILKSGKEIAESKAFYISKKSWQSCSKPLRQSGTSYRNFFTLANLTQTDGSYEIILKAGDKVVRKYTANVAGGKLQQHPRSAMDYSPHADYITPKIIDRSSGTASNYQMFDAYWVDAK
ncbi:MAG: hypothetical protein D8M58_04830 [Calditrichaeota bacterium]|nr:MAG: hypothetical protein DWQ03_02245 [Calditrichota bacterium]MBL1204697.1 hypothetical protein [Calditrichota bacterium]NOG44525.1 hypothetical protein [Calditrichota bacterium]